MTVDPTFKAAVSDYIAYIDQRLRSTTIRTYYQISGRLIESIGANTPLSKVNARDLENKYGFLCASTANQVRSVLAGIYALARKNGYEGPDPSQELERMKKKPPAPIDVYTPAEIMKLADAANSLQDRAIFLCAGLAGLRLSELRALRWTDINTESKMIHVRRGYTNESGFAAPKSGKERSVPMVPQLEKVLRNLAFDRALAHPIIIDNQMELVFCNEDWTVIDGNSLYRRFLTASKHAGLRRLRFHDLRHSFACMAIHAFPITDVKEFMGHADISTTMKYIHHQPRKDAAEKLGALVG